MAMQMQFPLPPFEAQNISSLLAIYRENGQIFFYNGSSPIYFCAEEDKEGIRIASVLFSTLELASVNELSDALGIHRTTIFRNRIKLEEHGIASLLDLRKTEDRTPYKVTGDKKETIQESLDTGLSIRQAAREAGITEGAIRYGIRKGRITRPVKDQSSGGNGVEENQEDLSGSFQRSEKDQNCTGGVAVKRLVERSIARTGELREAAPEFLPAEAVPGGGVLLALPALLGEGLLKTGEKVYGGLKNGYFGLKSILLVLAFMALLRIKTVEQIRSKSPGELGILLGLDRAPEVKTLRRKLKELGGYNLAAVFKGELAKYWAEKEPDSLGYLYIDVHVRPYHGRKHTLPKTHVARRRLCMPATTDFWVNDTKNDPLFFVTAPANDGLLSMIDQEICPEVRSLVADDRRITLIFDREGWSPKYFKKWAKEGFDVITYRKGRYEQWAEDDFSKISEINNGKRVTYLLGEKTIELGKGFMVREVRRLCDDGHQTSIISTRFDLSPFTVAIRMFDRWRQENFFRYMRHEFALDSLCTYDTDLADPNRMVPNPEKKGKEKELAPIAKHLHDLERDYGKNIIENEYASDTTIEEIRKTHTEKEEEIAALKEQCEQIKTLMRAMPERVKVKQILEVENIVGLETERKTFTDIIKMIAYRAETTLAEIIEPFFVRHENEARSFLKKVFQMQADIIPDRENQSLTIRLHGMPTWREQESLATLCDFLTSQEICFPGTDLQLYFKTI